MNRHRTIIKRTLTGLLLATAFAGATAGAAVPSAPCVASAKQTRRACELECAASGNCSMEYRAAHAECVAETVAGPGRQDCILRCQQERAACRSEVKACKVACGQEFHSLKAECAGN